MREPGPKVHPPPRSDLIVVEPRAEEDSEEEKRVAADARDAVESEKP